MSTDASAGVDGAIHDTLGIRTVEATGERVVLEMDVGPRVHQPSGLLHGGASAVMAESAASFGALVASPPGHRAIGTDLNISHLRGVSSGRVRALATPIRKGRTLQVWGVDLVDERGELFAVARCTIAIRPVAAEEG